MRINPNDEKAFYNRGVVRADKGDLDGAIADYNEAIRLTSDYVIAYYNRAIGWEKKKNYSSAIADFQKYLELGGGIKVGNQKVVEETIRKLKHKLTTKKPAKKKTK